MVVKEMLTSDGAIVRFHDDNYIHSTNEKINQEVKMFLEIAVEIFLDSEIDKSESSL